MTESLYQKTLRLIRGLPFMGRSFEIYPDSFSRNQRQLVAGVVGLAVQRASAGERVILVAQFGNGFLELEQELVAVKAEFTIGSPKAGVADLLEPGLILSLGNAIPSIGDVDPKLNWLLDERLKGRLNVMVLQRHPFRVIDDAMTDALKKLPLHVRVGFFLSLDDPLIGVSVNEALVEVLEQMGMQQHQLISSRMLTRRVRATQRRIAAVVTDPKSADSVQEWMDLNLPEPKVGKKKRGRSVP